MRRPRDRRPTAGPGCDDLSAYLIAGRLKGTLDEEPRYETDVRTPAQGIEDGVEAERLGFRRAFIAERFDLKEVVRCSAVPRPGRPGSVSARG